MAATDDWITLTKFYIFFPPIPVHGDSWEGSGSKREIRERGRKVIFGAVLLVERRWQRDKEKKILELKVYRDYECKTELEINRRVFFNSPLFCLFLRVQEVGVFPVVPQIHTEGPLGVRPKTTILLFSEQKHTNVAPQSATHRDRNTLDPGIMTRAAHRAH